MTPLRARESLQGAQPVQAPVLLMSSSATDVEPTQASGAPLVSPRKAMGPTRRPPSHTQPKESTWRDVVLTLVVLLSLAALTIFVAVFVSIMTTQTLTFGYELEEIPGALGGFLEELKKEVLPEAYVSRIGRIGKATPLSTRRVGSLNYQSLPIYTAQNLKDHDGSSPTKPIWLSITGLVFDVSAGRQHYSADGAYHFLAGKDATVSFASGCFDEECFATQKTGWEAMDADGRRGVNGWIVSYKEKYKLIGRLRDVYEQYHANNPANRHQKYFTPLNLETERAQRASAKTRAST